MSIRDNLDFLKQGPTYEEQDVKSGSSDEAAKLNEEILNGSNPKSGDDKNNPFKRKKKSDSDDGGNSEGLDKVKILKFVGVALAVVIIVVLFYFGYSYVTRDRGTDWMQEMEEGELAAFQYSVEERELLRVNGYTADDIERFEVEERDPYILVEEAEAARQAKYDEEIKPYLDGASPKFNELKALTWLGTGSMSPEILVPGNSDLYEERYGTYNCDYVKVPAYGSQLFLKLDLKEFNTSLFMTVTPERYMELDDNGNIVVTIEYNKYQDESILVTDIYEKDIKE